MGSVLYAVCRRKYFLFYMLPWGARETQAHFLYIFFTFVCNCGIWCLSCVTHIAATPNLKAGRLCESKIVC